MGAITDTVTTAISTVAVKSFVYVSGFFLVGQSMKAISDYMPVWNFNNAFSGVPDAFLYGLWYVDAPGVLNIIIPSYALSFAFARKSVFGG